MTMHQKILQKIGEAQSIADKDLRIVLAFVDDYDAFLPQYTEFLASSVMNVVQKNKLPEAEFDENFSCQFQSDGVFSALWKTQLLFTTFAIVPNTERGSHAATVTAELLKKS